MSEIIKEIMSKSQHNMRKKEKKKESTPRKILISYPILDFFFKIPSLIEFFLPR
jgi:hypothetical protein